MTDEFEQWLESCDEDIQEAVVAIFPLLREQGPQLPRPFADTLNGSRHPNMKELRPAKTIRVMFAFDPRRTGILLIGGDKAGQPQQRWYKRMIAKADKIFDRHLAGLAGKESR